MREQTEEGGAGRSAPDVTVVRMEECEGVLWNTIQDLSSDHVPIEIEWRKETRINKKIRRVEPNLRKGDWDRYRSEMEQRIGSVSEENNMKRKLEKLTSLMCEVAAEVCPARVVREEAIPWVTAEIRQLRRERNRARRDMTRRRGEWMEKCRELKDKTREAKREVWRRQLSKIQEEKNTNRAWRVIKGLKGEKQGEHSGAMLYEGRWRVTPRSKANAFMQEYANISKSISNRATRQERRRVAKHLRGMRPRREIEKEFTILELKNSIKSLKNGKAPGPDEIRPEYLKYLPLAALEQVLVLANYSWRHSWVPQKWRTATIVPILKKGKEPSQVGSYRPIALTSHLGKCVEKMVNARLMWWLEEHGKLSPYQAGFRAGRSTTDQCLRLSQRVSDGFQQKPPQRTLLALFDYSRAFDTVRRTALLEKMIKKGVPETYIAWTRSWLSNRTARVRVGDELGRTRVLREGVPQGAVLSPLLFIIFIDDLLDRFKGDTLVSAYADDLALAVSGSKKEVIETDMQEEVDKVAEWSKEYGLTLNIGKCEACLFTPSTAEYKWKPTLTIAGQTIQETQHPRFLGITYDKMLTFHKHTEEVTSRMRSRMCLLNAVGGADWGWNRDSMRLIFTATQRSIAEYGSTAWAPWISQTAMEKIECAQRRAARRITGATASTPAEALNREAGLEEQRIRYLRSAVCMFDRWNHLEENDPRRQIAGRVVPQRTAKRDWREQSRRVYEGIMRGVPTEAAEDVRRAPPWRSGVPGPVIRAATEKTETAEDQRRAAEMAVAEAGEVDLTIFTDGAVEDGVGRGGAGVLVQRQQRLHHSWSAPAGAACSSYAAELTAMGEAVEWLARRPGEWITAAVVSDSRSLLDALQGDAGESRLRRLRERLWELSEDGKDVTLVWVPGHCGLPGNEEADRLAGLGCELEQTGAELDGATRRAVIRRGIKGQDVRHERLREVYTGRVREDEESAMRREDRTDLTRFRTGHHPKLRRWQVMVGREGSADCRLCGLGEESSTHLWTECEAVEDLRRRHQLGRTHAELVEQPLRAWAMLRSILSRLGD